MNFDYTKGKSPRYMVFVYRGFVNDRYYVHTYNEAKKLFNELKEQEAGRDSSVSIYDFEKDIRKEFAKV